MPLGLTTAQVLALATGGLLEVCLLLVLAIVVARGRARAVVARRRDLHEQGPPVVVGVVVDREA